MRKFSVRWWVEDPRGRYEGQLVRLLWRHAFERMLVNVVETDTLTLREQFRRSGCKFHPVVYWFEWLRR